MGHDPGKKVINPPIRGTVTSLLTSPQLQKEDGLNLVVLMSK